MKLDWCSQRFGVNWPFGFGLRFVLFLLFLLFDGRVNRTFQLSYDDDEASSRMCVCLLGVVFWLFRLSPVLYGWMSFVSSVVFLLCSGLLRSFLLSKDTTLCVYVLGQAVIWTMLYDGSDYGIGFLYSLGYPNWLWSTRFFNFYTASLFLPLFSPPHSSPHSSPFSPSFSPSLSLSLPPFPPIFT